MFADDRQLSTPLVPKWCRESSTNYGKHIVGALFTLTHRVLSGRGAESTFLPIRDRGGVSKRPYISKSHHAKTLVHQDATPLLREPSLFYQWVRYIAHR